MLGIPCLRSDTAEYYRHIVKPIECMPLLTFEGQMGVKPLAWGSSALEQRQRRGNPAERNPLRSGEAQHARSWLRARHWAPAARKARA